MLKISSNSMTFATLPLEDDGLLISKVATGVGDSSKIRVTYSSYNYSNEMTFKFLSSFSLDLCILGKHRRTM